MRGYFDEGGLDPSRTVVRCATQEEADMFIEYLESKGVWNKAQAEILMSLWKTYKHSTCYHLCATQWCDESWYRQSRPDYLIVDFCDIYIGDTQHEKPDYKISFDEIIQGVKENA